MTPKKGKKKTRKGPGPKRPKTGAASRGGKTRGTAKKRAAPAERKRTARPLAGDGPRPAGPASASSERGGKAPARSPKVRAKGGPGRGGPSKGRVRAGPPVQVRGVFEGNARGFGFVRPDQEGVEDVFIPPRETGPAIHGDKVLVEAFVGGGRGWGRVLRVTAPRQDGIVGLFNGTMVIPRDPRINCWVRVSRAERHGAERGDMVKVELTRRGIKGIYGRVAEIIGDKDDPDIESRLVLSAHGFEDGFPHEALEEAAAAPADVLDSDLAGREDLTKLFTMTVDPATSRDFDDAVSIERLPESGGYRLWVSIADVAHYVRPGSAIDGEAYARATSVYLPGRAVHMLPEELSANICSLRPGVRRCAMTAEMDFDSGGRRTGARLYNSVILSDHRLSYDQVEEMETGRELRSEFPGAWERVVVMRDLMELRRGIRLGRGAVDLDVPEAEVVLGADGKVQDIARREQTWSHRLIEEFMLAANECVASFMTSIKSPMVYRIHEPPAPDSVERLAEMLAPLGFQIFGKDTDPLNFKPGDLQRVIGQSRGTPYEMLVKVLALRAMMQARYSDELAGHFGLASPCYCHFTSPIRRYPDLIVHRLLKRQLGRGPAVAGAESRLGDGSLSEGRPGDRAGDGGPLRPESAAPEDLSTSALHCSERERAAMAVEREMVDYYACLWMADRMGREFGATVSGATARGLFVVLDEAFVEGFLPVEAIGADASFNEKELSIRRPGEDGSFRIGDALRVWPEKVDLDSRRIYFSLCRTGND